MVDSVVVVVTFFDVVAVLDFFDASSKLTSGMLVSSSSYNEMVSFGHVHC